MHITIDTSNITDADRAILAQVLGLASTVVAADTGGETATHVVSPAADVEQEKPKRTRRTKAQIAADEEAAKATEQEQDEPVPANEPTAASEDAESDAKQEPTDASEDAATIEQVTGLATLLIQKDRSAMVELLKQFGARRVSEIPESDLGKFASEIRSKLA